MAGKKSWAEEERRQHRPSFTIAAAPSVGSTTTLKPMEDGQQHHRRATSRPGGVCLRDGGGPGRPLRRVVAS